MKKRLLVLFLIASLTLTMTLPVRAETLFFGLKDTIFLYSNIKENYTGPAVTKTVLRYLSGEEYSQSVLANCLKTTDVGTYLQDILDTIHAEQNKKSFAIYNGQDFETFVCSIYDTIVRRDAPVIVGINPSGLKDWPNALSAQRYVVVYQISSDLQSVKLADPVALANSIQGGPFYELSAKTLFSAYIKANVGLSYGVDSPVIVDDTRLDHAIELKVKPQKIKLADLKNLRYSIINNSKQSIAFGLDYTLQKWNTSSKAWSDVLFPGDFVFAAAYLDRLKPRETNDYIIPFLDALNLTAGSYRIAKRIELDPGKSYVLLLSNSFIIE